MNDNSCEEPAPPLPHKSRQENSPLQKRHICPKCKGNMDLGFIPEFSEGSVHPATWIQGPPQKSFWWGTKVRNKPRFVIDVFRCEMCGYLESYATQPK